MPPSARTTTAERRCAGRAALAATRTPVARDETAKAIVAVVM
jgi:hypothetical protein